MTTHSSAPTTPQDRQRRGGNRPGSGRKPLGAAPMERRTVTLPRDTIRRLERLGDGNLSAGIRAFVAEHPQPD